MKKAEFLSKCIVSLGAGALAAVFMAPVLHTHADPRAALEPMWAHNYGTLEEMVDDVDAVIVGKVINNRAGRTIVTAAPGLLPFTLVDVKVEQVLRGRTSPYLTLEQTGGTVADFTYHIEGDGGPYRAGERVLLFLKRQPDTPFFYLAHPVGRYGIEGGVLRAVVDDHPVAGRLDGRRLDEVSQALRSMR